MREGWRRYRGFQSFVDAARGVKTVFRTEWNFRIHLVIASLVLIAGLFFHIDWSEWIALTLSIGAVLGAEMCNTAVEYLADAVHPEADRGIGMAKDAAAGGVLVTAIAAAIVGAIVFVPKLWNWLMTIQ